MTDQEKAKQAWEEEWEKWADGKFSTDYAGDELVSVLLASHQTRDAILSALRSELEKEIAQVEQLLVSSQIVSAFFQGRLFQLKSFLSLLETLMPEKK